MTDWLREFNLLLKLPSSTEQSPSIHPVLSQARILVVVTVAVFATGMILVSAAPPGIASQFTTQLSTAHESSRNAGGIEGVVRYQADPKRPWRFSRYYVANAKGGALAEAVVALEGITVTNDALPVVPQTRTMDQVNYQFAPETMVLRAGDSVRIVNSDAALHNVMTMDGDEPFNVNVAQAGDFTHTFQKAGGIGKPIHLGCVFHGGMRAWIFVFDHPWFQLTAREGKFRFEHVPAGEYTLRVVHPAGKLNWSRRVVIEPNHNSSLEIELSPDNLAGGKSAGE